MMRLRKPLSRGGMVCGCEGEKGVLATSELVDRGSWHTAKGLKASCAVIVE
jgi:hypothetical protein